MGSAQIDSIAGAGGYEPPRYGGGLPLLGHIVAFARNPYRFMQRVADSKGDIARFKLFNQTVVLLTGDEASELFYRSSDEQLDQSAAYQLMTPIFGKGLVFDAPIERKNEQLRMLMPSLRMEAMRDHSHKIVREVEEAVRDWGEAGGIELVEFMKQLTINTASHCLLGREFRYELSAEFASIYSDLEAGVHPLAYHFPNLPLPAFRRRDRARARLQELVGGIVRRRQQVDIKPTDMFQTLIDTRYQDGTALTDNEITGLLIGAIFAGHHTSSGTAAWVLLELLRHPQHLRAVRAELDALLGAEGVVSFQSVREMGELERVLKEVLRLHPPLIVLMRKVSEELHFRQYTIHRGDIVWAAPPVTHRLARHFADPAAFDPGRYAPERGEDRNLMAYQPFGGGKHKCSGNAFALFQIKAIFAVLLRRYDFELVDPPASYVDDYGEMIVQPRSPCRVRFRRRAASSFATRFGSCGRPLAEGGAASCPHAGGSAEPRMAVVVDRLLCQGHAMCMGEAPEVFRVDGAGEMRVLDQHPAGAQLARAREAARHCPNRAISLVQLD